MYWHGKKENEIDILLWESFWFFLRYLISVDFSHIPSNSSICEWYLKSIFIPQPWPPSGNIYMVAGHWYFSTSVISLLVSGFAYHSFIIFWAFIVVHVNISKVLSTNNWCFLIMLIKYWTLELDNNLKVAKLHVFLCNLKIYRGYNSDSIS